MNEAQATLRARREALVARAAAQRDEIARGFGSLKRVSDGADRAIAAIGHVKRLSPVFGVGLGLAALLAARSKRIGNVVRGATTAWRTTRSVMGLVASLRR